MEDIKMLKSKLYPIIIALIVFTFVVNPAKAGDESPIKAAPTDMPGIKISMKEKRIEIDGEISRELTGNYASQLGGAIEYVAVSKDSGKEYESILVLNAAPEDIYNALKKLGVKSGNPTMYDEEADKMLPPAGAPVRLLAEWKDANKVKRVRVEELIYNIKTKKKMKKVDWLFAGSCMGPFDPESDTDVLKASWTKCLISFHDGDDSVLLQHPKPVPATGVPYRPNSEVLPKAGTKIKFIIDADFAQLFVLISGRVQGVGFRNFTQQNARKLGIKGYAKNLQNGKVEVVAEGHKSDLAKLLKKLNVGPAAAKVTDVKKEERPISGEYKVFKIKR